MSANIADTDSSETPVGLNRDSVAGPAFAVLASISVCHCLNDLVQSLVPALYPILKTEYALDFAQIGLITLAFQLTASLLQPLVGLYTDRRSRPFSLAIGMGFSLLGLLLLSRAASFEVILLAAALIGTGSAVFHPEASRVVRSAAAGRHGFGQSIFQVGGNFGQAAGPLLAAFIVVPRGQASVAWFSLAALAAMLILVGIGTWYRRRLVEAASRPRAAVPASPLTRRRIGWAVAILIALVFSKNFYTASLTSYYTFYLIHRFGVSVQDAQVYLFVFLAAVALGVVIGGPIGDRFGRKVVIWVSILGVLPFTLALPYVGLTATVLLTIPIGLIIASSFPAIVVYAQELMPGRVGVVSGLFFGLSFGMGGLGAAVLGEVADHTSIEFVYSLCAWLPAIGLIAAFLPRVGGSRSAAR